MNIYERLPNEIQETINFKVWGEADRKYKNIIKGKEELKKVLYNDIKNLIVNRDDLFFKDYRLNKSQSKFWSKEFIKHIENYYYKELDKAFIKRNTNAIVREIKLCIKLFSNMDKLSLNYHNIDIDTGVRLVHANRRLYAIDNSSLWEDINIDNEFFRIFYHIKNNIPDDEPQIIIELEKDLYRYFTTQLNRFYICYIDDDNKRFH